MIKAKCPRCGKTQAKYSAEPWRNFFRHLLGSDRRYCVSCHKKWFAKDLDENWRTKRSRRIAYGVIASYVVVLLVAHIVEFTLSLEFSGSEQAVTKSSEQSPSRLKHGEQFEEGTAPQQTESSPSFFGDIMTVGKFFVPFGGAFAKEEARLVRAEEDTIIKRMSRAVEEEKDDNQYVKDLEGMSKKALWKKYGEHFSSQAEAKRLYEEYQNKDSLIRKRIKER